MSFQQVEIRNTLENQVNNLSWKRTKRNRKIVLDIKTMKYINRRFYSKRLIRDGHLTG